MIKVTKHRKDCVTMAKFLKDIVNDVSADKDNTLTKAEIEFVMRKAIGFMGDYLSDNQKLYLIGFMNFEPKDYKEKNSKHPQTQVDMVIPAYRGVLSKPSDPLKEKLAAGHKRDNT